jgi:hypothetical protein
LRSKILETLYQGYEDYAVDNRGDVGSWVREECMNALYIYINLIVNCDDESIKDQLGAYSPQFYERFLCANI